MFVPRQQCFIAKGMKNALYSVSNVVIESKSLTLKRILPFSHQIIFPIKMFIQKNSLDFNKLQPVYVFLSILMQIVGEIELADEMIMIKLLSFILCKRRGFFIKASFYMPVCRAWQLHAQ